MQPIEEGVFLPPEIWTQVLNFFPDETLLPLRTVSHSFEEIIASLFQSRHPKLIRKVSLTLSYQSLVQKRLNNRLLAGLGSLRNLMESLTLSQPQQLTEADLKQLGARFTALRSLTFQDKSEFGTSITPYPNLQALSSFQPLVNLSFMSPQRFNGENLSQLSTLCLTRLASLHFYQCPHLNGKAIETFLERKPLPALHSLHFSNHSDFEPKHLRGLTTVPSLSSLYLNTSPLFGGHFTSLPLKGLSITHLDLSFKTLSDTDLRAIATALKLNRLFITSSTELSNEGVASLTPLSHLEQLTLDDCPKLSDSIFETLLRLPSLAFLSLYRMENLSDKGLETLSHSTTLHSLYLDRLKNITGVTLPALTSLTTLNLSQLENLTPSPLPFSSRLYSLTLWSSKAIPPETLRHYGRILPAFTHHDQTIV